MSSIFCYCSSLREINLFNINTNNIIKMKGMFLRCSSLKYINISDFNFNYLNDISGMFYGCSNEIRMKIKSKFKNIKEEAFEG